jgi:hypothetical protein
MGLDEFKVKPSANSQWVLVVGAILVGAGIYYYGIGRSAPAPKQAPAAVQELENEQQRREEFLSQFKKKPVTAPNPDEKAHPAAKLRASELWEEYVAHPAVADSKFLGHWIEVTGAVLRVEAPKEDPAFVVLESGQPKNLSGIRCYFAEGENLADVHDGQKLTVRGICAGRQFDVALKECFRVKQ